MGYLVKSNIDINSQLRELAAKDNIQEEQESLAKLLQIYYDCGLKFVSLSDYGYVFQVISNPMC